MDKNLDKIFKDSLHDRRFEMKESDWLGAEKLLEADERRRNRGGLLWWMGGGLALLSLGILLALGFGGNEATDAPNNIGENNAQAPVAVGVETPTFPSKTETKVAPSSEQAEIPDAHLPQGQNNLPTNSLAQHSTTPIISLSNAEQRVGKQQVSSSVPKSNIGESIAAAAETTMPSPTNTATSNNSPDPIAKQTPNTTDAMTNGLLESGDTPWLMERQFAPDYLATLPAFVKGGFMEIMATKTTYSSEKIEVPNRRKLHLGLSASQILLPPPFDNDKQTRIGVQAGLIVKLELQAGFYLSSGIQYQRRTGSFEASELATVRSYRFGLELDTLPLRPTSIHYLSMPALVGWDRNRHQLEGGIMLDLLTGMRGETGSYRKTGEPPVKVFVADQKGWINTVGFRRLVPTAQLGYRYQFGKSWAAGMSVNYNLGGILDKSHIAPIGDFLLKESDHLYMGLQLAYFIN